MRIQRKMDDYFTIEYEIIHYNYEEQTFTLQKVRYITPNSSRDINANDDQELDVFVRYPILYVLNDFKKESKWEIK